MNSTCCWSRCACKIHVSPLANWYNNAICEIILHNNHGHRPIQKPGTLRTKTEWDHLIGAADALIIGVLLAQCILNVWTETIHSILEHINMSWERDKKCVWSDMQFQVRVCSGLRTVRYVCGIEAKSPQVAWAYWRMNSMFSLAYATGSVVSFACVITTILEIPRGCRLKGMEVFFTWTILSRKSIHTGARASMCDRATRPN